MLEQYNYIIIPLCVLLILFGLSFLTYKYKSSPDHFGNINSLKIKYNDESVVNPKKLQEPSVCEQEINETINSELSSQPLGFTKQIYSSNKYPYVGQPELCTSDEHCDQITAECNNNLYSTFGTIGSCGLKNLDTTVFGINY